MKRIIIAVMLLSLVSAPAAFAGKIAENAGCGIGTLLWESVKPNGGWLLQSLAVYTNDILSNTFSMTTGTINCKGTPSQVVKTEVYEFVNDNLDNLAKEIAQGKGETIESLAAMLNINNVDAYATTLQANFSEIFPSAEVQSIDVTNKLVALI